MGKREQIIESAMQLLVEKGEHACPMSLVSKEAACGMGTIYNYYPTKEDLINAVYLYIKEDEKNKIFKPFESDAIKKKFDFYYASFLTYMIENKIYFQFMDQFHSSPIITEETRNKGAETIQYFVDILVQGQEQGIIKEMDIEELLQFLYGGMMGFVRWVHLRHKSLTTEMLKNQLQMAWDVIKK